MKTKLTKEILLNELPFKFLPGLIQDSYHYVITDEHFTDEILKLDSYSYKAISLAMCNDKGQGEYYLFIRQGETNKRHEDDIISITSNLQYKEDLEAFINILKL